MNFDAGKPTGNFAFRRLEGGRLGVGLRLRTSHAFWLPRPDGPGLLVSFQDVRGPDEGCLSVCLLAVS